jgi:hypothetical protein
MNEVATKPTPDPSHLTLVFSVYPSLRYDQFFRESESRELYMVIEKSRIFSRELRITRIVDFLESHPAQSPLARKIFQLEKNQ